MELEHTISSEQRRGKAEDDDDGHVENIHLNSSDIGSGRDTEIAQDFQEDQQGVHHRVSEKRSVMLSAKKTTADYLRDELEALHFLGDYVLPLGRLTDPAIPLW